MINKNMRISVINDESGIAAFTKDIFRGNEVIFISAKEPNSDISSIVYLTQEQALEFAHNIIELLK